MSEYTTEFEAWSAKLVISANTGHGHIWGHKFNLIDTYKIINCIYNVKTELFFDYDQSGRRGHSKKLFKRRSRLDIRKFAFSNRIVDRWNSLSECCVTCNSINCFKSHISSKLESKTTWSVDILDSGLYNYGIKAVPTKPSVRRYWWPSVNSVKFGNKPRKIVEKHRNRLWKAVGCIKNFAWSQRRIFTIRYGTHIVTSSQLSLPHEIKNSNN